jgi:hypothetical protein
MSWIKFNISSIGIWVYTISFTAYYILARPLDINRLSHPIWVDNIEFYGSFVGILLICLGYALKCNKRIERVILAWGLVAFWGMLLFIYTMDEFFDSILFTHKIITNTIFCLISCPFFYYYFRKRL